jgi:thioredoxin-like negative regulator of GroEL
MSSKSRKQQLEAMLAEDPADAFLLYGLAMEYVSEGDDEGALSRFRALFADRPDYVPAYVQAGQALIRLGRSSEAAEVFRRGIDVARSQRDDHAAEEMQVFLDSIG